MPKVPLGPTSRHLFKVPESAGVNFVKLNMYPDGGIVRNLSDLHVKDLIDADTCRRGLECMGMFRPFHPKTTPRRMTWHMYSQVVVCRSYLISTLASEATLSIRAEVKIWVMDGRLSVVEQRDIKTGLSSSCECCSWRRSRTYTERIICRGAPGYLQHVEIDTAHFKGNFPESFELHALYVSEDPDWEATRGESEEWSLILSRTKLGPHRQHYFQLEDVEGKIFSHVRVTIHPDGGLKRVRVFGSKALGVPNGKQSEEATTQAAVNVATSGGVPVLETVPVLPLTPEAFAAFGQVVEAYEDHDAVPKGTKITPANAGTASKFHKLSLLTSNYPPESNATSGLSVYRCKPLEDIQSNKTTPLKALERHSFTNQAFVPMGRGGGEGLSDPGTSYLVVVAQNGEDDKPDFKTLRAFLASSAQGIVYKTGLWRKWPCFSRRTRN